MMITTKQHSITLPEIRTRTHKIRVNTPDLRSTNSVILVSSLNIVQYHKHKKHKKNKFVHIEKQTQHYNHTDFTSNPNPKQYVHSFIIIFVA